MNQRELNNALDGAVSSLKRLLKWAIIGTVLLALIILLAYLGGGNHSEVVEKPDPVETVGAEDLDGEVYRFTDTETNATCYVYDDGTDGVSISCYPEEG